MTTIKFHTNLDVFNEEWPEVDTIPHVGWRIISRSGLELEVYAVRIKAAGDKQGFGGMIVKTTLVEVELHLPKNGSLRTIQEFNNWYNKRRFG